jgi:hypothetical protein
MKKINRNEQGLDLLKLKLSVSNDILTWSQNHTLFHIKIKIVV